MRKFRKKKSMGPFVLEKQHGVNFVSHASAIITGIHVISFKGASGRLSFHFREVYEKCIEYISLHLDEGVSKIL